MSQPKRPNIQKRFEHRMDFIFGGRIIEREQREEALINSFLATDQPHPKTDL